MWIDAARRHGAACLACVLAWAPAAQAADAAGPAARHAGQPRQAADAGSAMPPGFPARPLTIVVTFPPGGGTDLLARKVGAELALRLGQRVLVENRAGASGNIGAKIVADSPPDGHTLLMVNSSFAINPGVFSTLAFDPRADFVPVVNMAYVPSVIVVRQGDGVPDLAALRTARQEGGASYASCGNGTPQHLAGAMLAQAGAAPLRHIPYKGCGPALADLLGGQVDAAIVTASSASPHLAAGKLRALAITSRTRSVLLPGVPTVAEQGVPGYELDQWHGLLAPAGTPVPVVEALNRLVGDIVSAPAMREQLLAQGFAPTAGSVAAFGRLVEDDMNRFARLTASIGLRVD